MKMLLLTTDIQDKICNFNVINKSDLKQTDK